MKPMRARRRGHQHGVTVLEIMIVVAIIGMMAWLAWGAVRVLTGAALDEDSADLALVMRRAQLLAVEAGIPTRVVIDFDSHAYWVETCAGDPSLVRVKEEEKSDDKASEEALEDARQKLSGMGAQQIQGQTPEDEARMALALVGKKVGGRVCGPLGSGPGAEDIGQVITGDAKGRDLRRSLRQSSGVKFREVWVQHLEQSVSTGQVSITFFPLGFAEKAIIEVGNDDEQNTVVVHGLTGRVELRGGTLDNPDDHMLRNAAGERDQERERAR